MAGALEGPNDVDTVAVGTQAVTQGTLVDICGGSMWLVGAGCERMADWDPSAIDVSPRHSHTHKHILARTHSSWTDTHPHSNTHSHPFARSQDSICTHSPSADAHPHADSRTHVHVYVGPHTPSHPLTCKHNRPQQTHTHTHTDSHHVHSYGLTNTPLTHTCLCVNTHPEAHSHRPTHKHTLGPLHLQTPSPVSKYTRTLRHARSLSQAHVDSHTPTHSLLCRHRYTPTH